MQEAVTAPCVSRRAVPPPSRVMQAPAGTHVPSGVMSQMGPQQTPKPETRKIARLHHSEETRTRKKSLAKLGPVNKNKVKIGKSTSKLKHVFSDQHGVNRARNCGRARRRGLQNPARESPPGDAAARVTRYRHTCE